MGRTIMDKYDPEKKVGLVVDEWGAWHGVEPGTNSRFLYQQNSLRDALVAGITLNIFNNHCDRVRMANIAQTVNVLQAMILTQGEKMILTPTYHAFEMYKVHQDATRLPIDFNCTNYEHDAEAIPAVSASASRNREGKVHVSLCNLHPRQATDVACELRGMETGSVRGRVLTAEHMTAHNTFDQTEAVKPATFTGARIEKECVSVQLPPKSVVVLELE
jgi:alpha-N-arabinofuranosidase